MTGNPWQVSSLGPAAVAVHDDADVARQLRAGRRGDGGGWGWSEHASHEKNGREQQTVSVR
jgi:hypothetical protein